MPSRWPQLVVALLLAVFLGAGSLGLGRTPKVYEDEALIAAPGYSLVTTGVFGTPLDPGFYGTEKHTYGLMPLFPILVGVSLRLFGLGLLQARLVPLLTAAGVLLLIHLVASRLLSAWHGVVAVGLLVIAPVSAPVAHLPAGIPLLDMARIVRYDIAVPLFGLAALLVLAPVLKGDREPSPARLMLAGLLTGLATLCHLYGIFWLPALLLPLVLARGRRAFLPWVWGPVGLLAALLPWLVFVASGWRDYVGQNLHYSDRFRLLEAGFYAANLRSEISRYGLVLKAATSHLSPWLFLLSLALGGATLLRRGPRSLLSILAVLVLCTAVLLSSKNVLYLAPLWPLFALVASAGILALWQRSGRPGRLVIVAAGVSLVFEGASAIGRELAEARRTTPYAELSRRLAALIPAGSRVVGMQHYWLGLAEKFPDYAVVPFHHALRRYMGTPVPFELAIERSHPDVFLLDPVLSDVLRSGAPADPEIQALRESVRDWLSRRGRLIATLDDPSYGRFEIYTVGPVRISARAFSRTSSTETRMRQWRSPLPQTGCMQAPQERSSL